jgi:hypothetical protein
MLLPMIHKVKRVSSLDLKHGVAEGVFECFSTAFPAPVESPKAFGPYQLWLFFERSFFSVD